MLLFPQYQPSERAWKQHVRAAFRIGLLPLFVAGALIYAKSFRAGPGLWAALGLTLGLQLILRGAQSLPAAENRSRFGTYLALRADAWFPLFLFAVQTGFILIALALLWLTLTELGFPASPWKHANVIALALLLPACRIAREAARFDDSVRLDLTERLLRDLCIILATTWMVTTLISFLAPPGEKPVDEYFPLIIALWVAGAVVVLICVALFLDHAAHVGKVKPGGPA
ncbi:MAG: hypothetical protein V1873_06640 [Verrucomicrobiota bacterium]